MYASYVDCSFMLHWFKIAEGVYRWSHRPDSLRFKIPMEIHGSLNEWASKASSASLCLLTLNPDHGTTITEETIDGSISTNSMYREILFFIPIFPSLPLYRLVATLFLGSFHVIPFGLSPLGRCPSQGKEHRSLFTRNARQTQNPGKKRR